MNNKSFLQGMMFAFAFADSTSSEFHIHHANPIMIWFKDGSYLTFAINRGIAHIYGNATCMLTGEESCNLFDIYIGWITHEQSKVIKSLNPIFAEVFDDYSEIRITFDDLVSIVDALGEIDYEVCSKEWLKIYLTKYHVI